MRDSLGSSQVRRTIIPVLGTLLLCGCGSSPPHRTTTTPLDSTQLVARALAACDSARGTHDAVQRRVRRFDRNGGTVIVSLSPVSPAIQGGRVDVQLDSTGRVLTIRLYQ
jgi:hypothetical protein